MDPDYPQITGPNSVTHYDNTSYLININEGDGTERLYDNFFFARPQLKNRRNAADKCHSEQGEESAFSQMLPRLAEATHKTEVPTFARYVAVGRGNYSRVTQAPSLPVGI